MARSIAKSTGPRSSGNLRIGDHWNAITIIALSQSNPLKAVAELVENSIDARAKTIVITRGKEKGQHYLRVKDDGEGVRRRDSGSEAAQKLREWMVAERKTTFVSRCTKEISLAEALRLEEIAVHGRRARGAKCPIGPNKGIVAYPAAVDPIHRGKIGPAAICIEADLR